MNPLDTSKKRLKKTGRISVLVTAGPTRAYLDQVRYLSNYSSGRLGYEVCRLLSKAGVEVSAVVGPTEVPFHQLSRVSLTQVETVEEMRHAVLDVCRRQKPQFAILSAAVLDFAPKKRQKGKVSSSESWFLELVPTPKIIDELTEKFPQIKTVAFKLEWKQPSLKEVKKFALENMRAKKADALCLNYLSQIKGKSHPAFLFRKDGTCHRVNSKQAIAKWIADYVLSNASLQLK